jgi:hypothetical protein
MGSTGAEAHRGSQSPVKADILLTIFQVGGNITYFSFFDLSITFGKTIGILKKKL